MQLQIILSGAVSWYLTRPNNLRRVREARSHPLSALAFGRRHATGRSVQCGAGKAAPRSLPCPVAGTVRRVCALQLLTWRWAWLALVSVPLPLGVLLWSGGRGTGPHRSRVADLAAHPCVPCGMGRAARTRAPSTDQRVGCETHQHPNQKLTDPGSWTACQEFEVSNVMFLSGIDSNGCVSWQRRTLPIGSPWCVLLPRCCCPWHGATACSDTNTAPASVALLPLSSRRERKENSVARSHICSFQRHTRSDPHVRRLARCSVQHSRTYFVRLTATRLMWPRGIVRRAGAGRPNIMSPPECRGKESRVAGTAAVHATQHVRIAGFPLVPVP